MATARVTGFLLRNALANAGGVIAFLPLLSLLMPIKIEAIAGEARLDVLTAAVIAGAVAASGSNILFGWLSDRAVARGGGRRTGAALGLALTALAYALVAAAASPVTIVAAIAFFQFAVNALLAPMFAIMADEIPDSHKRTAGGLLALGHPLGASVSAMLVAAPFLDERGRLAIVAVAVALCVAPLLATRPRPVAEPVESPVAEQVLRGDLMIAWGSRLLVQVAGAVLSVYLLYYFETIVPDAPRDAVAQGVGQVLALSYFLPLPIAVLIGRWSDRTGRGKPFLVVAAGTSALGLAGMALAADWTSGAVAFATYSVGWSVFLALHSGFAMQLLPDPRHRGRDLGLLNLTNTLPQLLGPAMTWLLATPHDFDAALLTLAVLTSCGALAILAVRGRR